MDHASGYILARQPCRQPNGLPADREPARSSRVKGVRSGPTVGGPPTIEGAGRVRSKVALKILWTLKKGERRADFSGYWLGPPLILTTSRLFCRPPPRAYARAPPPRCGRLQARRRTDLLTTISPLAIDLRGPFAARLDARALRRRCARTPKSGQLVPAARIDGAECARACCAGADADAARRAAQPAPNVDPRPAA